MSEFEFSPPEICPKCKQEIDFTVAAHRYAWVFGRTCADCDSGPEGEITRPVLPVELEEECNEATTE